MTFINPKDPIKKITSGYQQECFGRMCKAADAFQVSDVVVAAANVLVNALRQAHATRDQATARFDELFGQIKILLADHYDANGKRKAGVFPFHQSIAADHVTDKDKIKMN
jgi:hypothetical protein